MSDIEEDLEACPGCRMVSEDVALVRDRDGNLVRGLRRCFNARCRVKWYEVGNLIPPGPQNESAAMSIAALPQFTPTQDRFEAPDPRNAPQRYPSYPPVFGLNYGLNPENMMAEFFAQHRQVGRADSGFTSQATQRNSGNTTNTVLVQQPQAGCSSGSGSSFSGHPRIESQNGPLKSGMVTVFVRGVESRTLAIRVPASCSLVNILNAIQAKTSIPVNGEDFYIVRVREGKALPVSWSGQLSEGETLQASFRMRSKTWTLKEAIDSATA